MQPRGENLISKCISKSLYAAAIPISNGFLYVDLRNVPALKKNKVVVVVKMRGKNRRADISMHTSGCFVRKSRWKGLLSKGREKL